MNILYFTEPFRPSDLYSHAESSDPSYLVSLSFNLVDSVVSLSAVTSSSSFQCFCRQWRGVVGATGRWLRGGPGVGKFVQEEVRGLRIAVDFIQRRCAGRSSSVPARTEGDDDTRISNSFGGGGGGQFKSLNVHI